LKTDTADVTLGVFGVPWYFDPDDVFAKFIKNESAEIIRKLGNDTIGIKDENYARALILSEIDGGSVLHALSKSSGEDTILLKVDPEDTERYIGRRFTFAYFVDGEWSGYDGSLVVRFKYRIIDFFKRNLLKLL
jgi:hypothetical protein